MRGLRGHLLRWFPAVAYAGVIFVLSSTPGRHVPALAIGDKVAHLLLFTGFGAVLVYAWRRFWPAVSAASLYAALDELHQRFTPGRDASLLDLLADVTGVVLGAFAGLALVRLWERARGDEPSHGHRP